MWNDAFRAGGNDLRRPSEHLKMWSKFVGQCIRVREKDPTIFLTRSPSKDSDNKEWLQDGATTHIFRIFVGIFRATFLVNDRSP
ncbi:hypothetical protein TNCV_1034291 [Trichonephila clavipes]|nr:hypothetical protein TNCV_1034291 [Trichonephila clavipes]